MKKFYCLFIMLTCNFSLFATSGATSGKVTMLPSPAQSHASLPRLFTDAEGQVFISWVEQAAKQKPAQLFYAKLAGNAWGQAKMIASGNDWMLHWADFPALTVDGQHVTANYLQSNGGGKYSYDAKAVFSGDGGNHFGKPITVNLPGVKGENGMTSMQPLGDGQTFITWLDARNTKAHTGTKEGPDNMALMGAIFSADGKNKAQWQLDDRTCECCSTSVAQTSQGLAVVYRDRSDQEIRDIYIVRQVNGKWSAPVAVHHDNWHIAGCPTNGPAISAQQNQVAVAWFTLKNHVPTIQLKLSTDSGKSFGDLIEIASGATHTRPDVEILSSGDLVVSWLDIKPNEGKLMLAKYSQAGKLLDKLAVAKHKNLRHSGLPIITASGDDVYIGWTDKGDKEIKVAKVTWPLTGFASN